MKNSSGDSMLLRAEIPSTRSTTGKKAWGVLEQRLGNLSAARRLFRSSLNINSQSYITWMTWASLEEDQGNPIRAEEIRNLYFQQRTEVVDDSSSALGFLDIFDPALDSIKRLLKLDQIPDEKSQDFPRRMEEAIINNSEASSSPSHTPADTNSNGSIDDIDIPASDFDVDAYVKDKLHLDTSKLDVLSDSYEPRIPKAPRKKIWKSNRKVLIARP